MSASRITELSARIAANTAKVNEYLTAHNLPQPSFDADGPLTSLIPSTELAVASARQAAIYDCQELRQLLLGPTEHLTSFKPNELLSQHVITRFRLAQLVPIGGVVTFAELAAASGLNETHVRKLLRHAMTQRVFCEPRPGVVAHTASSRVLVEDSGLFSCVRLGTDDLWRAACYTGDAMAQFPGSEEPNETGFALANSTDKSLFGFFSGHPERLKHFAEAMRFFAERPGMEPRYVVEDYDWGSIPEGGTVVDVGGSHGVICIELARRFPGINFVVQDLDEPTIRDAEQRCPADVADRVRYMVHDFFNVQPVSGADIYFFRYVLHNWSDTNAIKILRNLIPSLKPGAKIIVNDVVVPEADKMPPILAESLRSSDLGMLMLLNAGEREMTEWAELFAKAHPGFDFQGGKSTPGSSLWVLKAEWKGD
ncbi:putative O-methyltransferase [Xylariaceae sp. AK1471]|nr:putative O-methyltransferase [Xylariaceae sp. AK1471]